MRLTSSAHVDQSWRIHGIAPDFRLEDAWAIDGVVGGADDFPRLVELMASYDPSKQAVVRTLFEIRRRLGSITGWDRPSTGTGARVASLLERVPVDLQGSAPDPRRALPFTPLYMTPTEWAAELANETVHGVLHLGWVKDSSAYRGQLAILVKPNGLLGTGYLAAIKPFRHLVVYPAMLRQLEREWQRVRA